MNKKFSNEQINILKKYYPKGKWDNILPYFPKMSRLNIRALARRYGIKQTDKNMLFNEDLTGKKFGKLLAIKVDLSKNNQRYWICKCDCGKTTSVSVYALIKGLTKSCGCLRHKPAHNSIDLTGHKFGMLTAIERLPQYKNGETYYRCICDCGKEDIYVYYSNLVSGHTRSCGTHNHKRIEFKKLNFPYDDDDRTYIVYRHIAPNGKSYIGITKQDAERRFQNGNGYKSQITFWRAIKKYGWENFRHEILEKNLTEKEASEKEQYYIKKVYNSFAPNGYNIAEGGITGNKIVTPIIQYYDDKQVNFFESISVASKTLGIAQFTIRSHFGKDNSVDGYYFERFSPIHTYEIPSKYFLMIDESHYNMKEVILKNLKETTLTRNYASRKAINKYDLEGHYICTYKSITEASKSIKKGKGGAISAAVNPKRQGETAYGYMWKYDNGNHSDIEKIKYKVKRSILQIDSNSGKVINEFESMAKAAHSIKSGTNGIGKACRSGNLFHGYLWKIKE